MHLTSQHAFSTQYMMFPFFFLQVALYQLASLHSHQQDVQQLPKRQSKRCGQQRKQEEHTTVSLPSVASVRLPGKVSSIAWCPDMEGVLSIGDYDGTLTQVWMLCV